MYQAQLVKVLWTSFTLSEVSVGKQKRPWFHVELQQVGINEAVHISEASQSSGFLNKHLLGSGLKRILS